MKLNYERFKIVQLFYHSPTEDSHLKEREG